MGGDLDGYGSSRWNPSRTRAGRQQPNEQIALFSIQKWHAGDLEHLFRRATLSYTTLCIPCRGLFSDKTAASLHVGASRVLPHYCRGQAPPALQRRSTVYVNSSMLFAMTQGWLEVVLAGRLPHGSPLRPQTAPSTAATARHREGEAIGGAALTQTTGRSLLAVANSRSTISDVPCC
ncbi:hypothetical protein N656DRAFT_229117 [Canariomyces notabilis]|uniref:Uncharacterized protein n=1 Tax=Canariomyces notabilis TaxID=2074819 RepID=A0AAN6TKI7_9PEZI|nr:hypothetical protein N656DRAFT_229117 [Canariomyces arenarius]